MRDVVVQVITVEPERRSLVLSERAELREGTLAALKEGDVRKAVVRSLADFGAFVELLDDSGSATFVEGLVHVSEISWDRVLHPQVGLGEPALRHSFSATIFCLWVPLGEKEYSPGHQTFLYPGPT